MKTQLLALLVGCSLLSAPIVQAETTAQKTRRHAGTLWDYASFVVKAAGTIGGGVLTYDSYNRFQTTHKRSTIAFYAAATLVLAEQTYSAFQSL